VPDVKVSAVRSGRGGRGERNGSAGLRQALQIPWWFAGLALFCYLLMLVYPSIAGTYYAFTDWSGIGAFSYVGLSNFKRVFTDGEALSSLKNTVFLAFTTTIIQNIVGLSLALALNGNSRLKAFLRPVFVAPVLLAPVVVGVIWQYIYSPEGALNSLLAVLELRDWQQPWLGLPDTALWMVAFTVVWQFAGLTMIIYLAGLQGIGPELYEAAAMDGSGRLRQFWDITVPLLAPAVTINVLLPFIGGLKLFDQVMMMTAGGPGYSTQTAALMIYRQAFTHGAFAYSTALAVVLTIGVALAAVVQLVVLRRREHVR
jgi:raffinose/stachyose/melibiose transport system permease protein